MGAVFEVGDLLTGAVVAALGSAGDEGRGIGLEHSKVRPVNEEYTKVGFLSLDASAGPLTSAVSMMRNERTVISPELPERSMPRSLS